MVTFSAIYYGSDHVTVMMVPLYQEKTKLIILEIGVVKKITWVDVQIF